MIWWRKKKTDLSVAGEVFCDVREGSPGVFQPGSLFLERYHICKTACGGFGEVLFAIDTEDRNRACAVKVVFLDRGASSSDRDFILTEVQLLAQMARTSQLLCALWDVDTGEFDDVPFVYLVMPFYEHGNLRSVMSRDDRPVRHILELAWALTYLNRRLHPFVHLDIKPENIFLSQNLFFGRDVYWVLPTERVVLGDFGLAKFGGEYFKNPVARGHSETYASPEQLRGEPVDFRSDMFSFGVVAYEYLTGSHPFGVGTFDETRRLVMSPGFVPPRLSKSRPDLPSSLVEAVSTCLNKDPVERWPDFGELMRQLCLDFACVCEPRPGTPTEYHESEGKAPLVFEEKALADFRRQGLDCCAAGPGWSPVPSTILFAEYGFKEHQDRFRQDSMGMKKLRVAAVSLYDSCPMYAEAKLVNELEILLKGDATQLVLDRLLEFYGNPEEDGTRASRIVQSRQFGELAKSSCFAALDAAALAVLRLYEAARVRRSPPTQQVFMHPPEYSAPER